MTTHDQRFNASVSSRRRRTSEPTPAGLEDPGHPIQATAGEVPRNAARLVGVYYLKWACE
jgi:hypothetical protein